MKKKIEFSKLIFCFVTFFIILLTLFSLYMMYKTNDLSPLAYLIPGWFGEMGITTGFYYNKAKAENLIISALKIILMLITIFIVPKLKELIEQNTTAKQRQELINFANIAIKIAEEYYKDKNKGKEKKDFVIDWLNKAGIKATEEQINNIIDMIVAWYNANGWNKVITKEVI